MLSSFLVGALSGLVGVSIVKFFSLGGTGGFAVGVIVATVNAVVILKGE